MTDELDPEPDDIVEVHFLADRETLEKLTTAAAIQGLDMNQAINHAMQHYEVALSAAPGQIMRFTTADNEVRRFYVIRPGISGLDTLLILGTALILVAAPLTLISPWFYFIAPVGVGIIAYCWARIKVTH